MTFDEQRALLVAYREWAREQDLRGFNSECMWKENFDAFLRLRQPPAVEPPVCPECRGTGFIGEPWCYPCSCVTSAPFWRVEQAPGGWWIAWSCGADGIARRLADGRPTRAEAEADGRASGLPEWPGGGE
jgi:hypothetical protein